ncbi:hypothetical protein VB715_11000 [Crocosphaera sp. UHCC 0190]|uniref:hypothetical protein n=1 Tax=Crocosphaera sp. UHCC 0190 TaxID=3110246 RepID=UPI002B216E6C|nr:hypothetical protein [Crocosphaera sp. UHCC 0190]MEA5510290.1 hypothetical protein [Crocosphaera sp. UHCC 0190]
MMMTVVPNTTRLEALEGLLINQLQRSGLSPEPLEVKCFLGELLIILIEYPNNSDLNIQKIEIFIDKILAAENLSQAYFVEIFYLVNGEYCQLEQSFTPSFFDLLSGQIFNKDTQIFWKKSKTLAKSWLLKLKNTTIINFKSHQLLWLLIGGSMGSFLMLSTVYILTRPCLFDNCQIISQAETIAQKPLNLLITSSADTALLKVKQNLSESVNLLRAVPWWSSYYSEASQLEQNYQQTISNITLILEAKDLEKQAILLYKKSPLPMSELQKIARLWQESLDKIKMINQDKYLGYITENLIQKYQEKIHSTAEQITSEKNAITSLKAAKEAAEIANKRQDSAQSLTDLQLVYATWKTAIKKIQNISPSTTVYDSSRPLLKTYLSYLVRAEKRKNQEENAVKVYEKAVNQAKLAETSETKNQWTKAVNSWEGAINYLQQIPQNTFKWNQSQPLLSAYPLSLNRAKNQLKKSIQNQKIQSELKAMCLEPQKICQYKITEELIKIQLDSHYLEQVWNLALQAKVEANLQIQVELLKHLSTFEYRLQNISKLTGKSVEVYNADGSLMTVYQGQQ